MFKMLKDLQKTWRMALNYKKVWLFGSKRNICTVKKKTPLLLHLKHNIFTRYIYIYLYRCSFVLSFTSQQLFCNESFLRGVCKVAVLFSLKRNRKWQWKRGLACFCLKWKDPNFQKSDGKCPKMSLKVCTSHSCCLCTLWPVKVTCVLCHQCNALLWLVLPYILGRINHSSPTSSFS